MTTTVDVNLIMGHPVLISIYLDHMGWHNNFFRTFYLYEFLNNNKNVFLFSAKGRVTDAARKREERKRKAISDTGTATGAANDSFEGIFVYIFGQGMVVCVCPSTVYANIKGTVSWKTKLSQSIEDS